MEIYIIKASETWKETFKRQLIIYLFNYYFDHLFQIACKIM